MVQVAPMSAIPLGTPAHYVLHSLIGGSDRKGVDWRPVSEMVRVGRYESQDQFQRGLDDLIDAGVVEPAEGPRGRTGYRVLEPCSCQVRAKVRRELKEEPDASEDAISYGRSRTAQPFPSGNNFSDLLAVTRTFPVDGAQAVDSERSELGRLTSRVAVEAEEPSQPQPEPEVLARARADGGSLSGPRYLRGKGQPVKPDSAFGLARYFEWKLNTSTEEVWTAQAMACRLEALAAAFKDTLARAWTADEIRTSIDLFLAKPPNRVREAPWRMYLRQRPALLDDARKRLRREQPEDIDAYIESLVTPKRESVQEEDVLEAWISQLL